MPSHEHKHIHAHFLTRDGCFDAVPLSQAEGHSDEEMHSGPDHNCTSGAKVLVHDELHRHGCLADDYGEHGKVGTGFKAR